MTKNKRIRRKWAKKYGKPGVERTYSNCVITDYSETTPAYSKADVDMTFMYLNREEKDET